MNFRKLTSAALAISAFCMLSSYASAQETVNATSDNKRIDAAWEDLLETEGNLLSNAQFVTLTNLAYQAASARVCDNHALDKDKIGKELDKILTAGNPQLTSDQNDERIAAILISFGARYGLFIAEGRADKEDFCANGDKFEASHSTPAPKQK